LFDGTGDGGFLHALEEGLVEAAVALHIALEDIVGDGDFVEFEGGVLLLLECAGELGLGLGISSGANLIGALRVQEIMGHDAPVVTIFCDDNKKYLSTDLARQEPVKPGYCSPEVELLGYSVLPAVRV
jgi:hypothetical protein